jgi:hypothetical protein
VNAIGALRYVLPHVPFPVEMDNFIHRRIALSLHALGGAIALLTGPLQFVPRFGVSYWKRHRFLGWVYCGAVLLRWGASLWIAPHSQTEWVASAGFLALGAAWIVATGLAVRFIVRGDEVRHRRWMIRSYALTAAAITLRMSCRSSSCSIGLLQSPTRPSRGSAGFPTCSPLRFTCNSHPYLRAHRCKPRSRQIKLIKLGVREGKIRLAGAWSPNRTASRRPPGTRGKPKKEGWRRFAGDSTGTRRTRGHAYFGFAIALAITVSEP